MRENYNEYGNMRSSFMDQIDKEMSTQWEEKYGKSCDLFSIHIDLPTSDEYGNLFMDQDHGEFGLGGQGSKDPAAASTAVDPNAALQAYMYPRGMTGVPSASAGEGKQQPPSEILEASALKMQPPNSDRKVVKVYKSGASPPKKAAKSSVASPKRAAKISVASPKKAAKSSVAPPKRAAKRSVALPKKAANSSVALPKKAANSSVASPKRAAKSRAARMKKAAKPTAAKLTMVFL